MAAPTRDAQTKEAKRLVRRSVKLTNDIRKHLDAVRELSDERTDVWAAAIHEGVSRNQLARACGLHHSQLRDIDANGDRVG